MKISAEDSLKLGEKFKINFKVVRFDEWVDGLNIELEHGKINKKTNVSDDDHDVTAKITMAHLMEDPRYYFYLKKLEARRDLYWSKRNKPSIFYNLKK